MTDLENTILALWQAIAEQDEARLSRFFTADAEILWPNTGERFDLAGYLRANCDYPGQWSGAVERVAPDGSYSVARVWSPEGVTARAVTFYQWRNGSFRWWSTGGTLPRRRSGGDRRPRRSRSGRSPYKTLCP